MAYKKELPASMVKSLAQRAAPFLAPEYNATLRDKFWKHVYNELPGTGTQQGRLQVVTGTDDKPVAVQISGTIDGKKAEDDGDPDISMKDIRFTSPYGQALLELFIAYLAAPVREIDASASL